MDGCASRREQATPAKTFVSGFTTDAESATEVARQESSRLASLLQARRNQVPPIGHTNFFRGPLRPCMRSLTRRASPLRRQS